MFRKIFISSLLVVCVNSIAIPQDIKETTEITTEPPVTILNNELLGTTENSTTSKEQESVYKKPQRTRVSTTSTEPAIILNQESKAGVNGSYNWTFQASDGTNAKQVAGTKMIGNRTIIGDIHGSYGYVDNDGQKHLIDYTANEFGYFPKGPDIFPEIASFLQYLEAHVKTLKKETVEIKPNITESQLGQKE
ncbi:hypothetical protein ABEB36_002933 [Hypothenemus hampei]|uniref:Uncharacterized protein n=1 Tax=Hypothenemus hampei TaxID=57062 RepID=A0ABD1FAM2_HYPHA